MRLLNVLLLLAASAVAMPKPRTPRGQRFLAAMPGGDGDLVVESDNTLNGTSRAPLEMVIEPPQVSTVLATATPLSLSFVNNFKSAPIFAYLQGKDARGRVVFVRADGSLLYPSSGGSEQPVAIDSSIAIPVIAPLGGTFHMELPGALSSARVYFSEAPLVFHVVSTPVGDGVVQPSVSNLKDPNAAVNWGFVELTYNPDGSLFANISYVDFVGMILSMSLQVSDGGPTQMTRGLPADAVRRLCAGLAEQAGRDSRPWDRMCVSGPGGRLLRVLSPNTYHHLDPNAFKGYWDKYIDDVWRRFAKEPLVVKTQSAEAQDTHCHVNNAGLVCDNDSRAFQKPTAADIWGCNSGPFVVHDGDSATHHASVPRLCAAFVRSTLLLPGGNVQPGPNVSDYYKAEPTNHYSRLVHSIELDGVGYAFPYDDVNPDGHPDSSGSLHSGAPTLLTVYIGGSG